MATTPGTQAKLDLLALLPYTKGELGKGYASFQEKVLVPHKQRNSPQRPHRKRRQSSTPSEPTTPSVINASTYKPKRSNVVKAEDTKAYEEYFRSSKYFQATGKIPDDWLINLSEEQMQEVRLVLYTILISCVRGCSPYPKLWVHYHNVCAGEEGA